ncbi:MAG: thiamine phosphate synthase [Tannerellaceae bacterium]|nr:thiamine phosphate synthase [Tannerellaceae bacterium]
MNNLLFITHTLSLEDTLNSVAAVLRGGGRCIQLRMKESSPEEIVTVGLQVKELCDQYHAEFYIDDYPSICKELNATGVHLGKNDMPVKEARAILDDTFKIGGTANTREDVRQLYLDGVDYIGLGPFRFTTTKKNLSPVLGLEGYKEIIGYCKETGINIPIIAIGGITYTDIPVLMQTGISGIALSSTILQADNPELETAKLIKLIKQHTI